MTLSPASHPSRKTAVALLAAAVAAAVPTAPWTAAAQTAAPPPTVAVARPVVKEVVEHDDYTGRFAAVDYVEVRARVTGYLTAVNFRDGAFVNKGDVLFVVDPRPYQATLDQAKAALASAKSRASFSQTDFERARSLTRSGNITEQAADQRRQAAETAQADVASAEANITQAALNLDFTQVRAPVSGKVSQRLVSQGNIVVADTTKLTTIVSLDPIYFSFTVDERSFLNYERELSIGMGRAADAPAPPVLIALTGEKDPAHRGRLDFVDNSVDDATGTVLLRATVENPDGLIKPGLFGTVSMPASEPYRAVLIPDEAVATNQDKRVVYVLAEDGTVGAREVRVGGKIDGYRIVRTGLDGSETIVVSGLTRVRPGAKVSPERRDLPPVRS